MCTVISTCTDEIEIFVFVSQLKIILYTEQLLLPKGDILDKFEENHNFVTFVIALGKSFLHINTFKFNFFKYVNSNNSNLNQVLKFLV